MYAIVFHAHQKLDRVAYRHLQRLLPPGTPFPKLQQILHFEGDNGPDSTKLKQASQEQPWHFVDPFNLDDTVLSQQIEQHYKTLVRALKTQDMVRGSFEAAWLAHALVDGLTPAHHYPYEKELENLRGEERTTRKGIVGRAYVKGDTTLQSMQRSLKLIGPKGLLTNHAMFEAGAYTIIKPLALTRALPTPKDLEQLAASGVSGLFRAQAKEIAELHIYERFIWRGWTQRLSRDIRQQMAPRMVRVITLAWYAAALEAAV